MNWMFTIIFTHSAHQFISLCNNNDCMDHSVHTYNISNGFIHPIQYIYLVNVLIMHAQDHRWWWPSFLSSGGVSIYVLLYAIYYFIAKLHMNEFVPALLYFGYSLIMAFAFFILSGRHACNAYIELISNIHKHMSCL
jgi:hypothetical protein